MEKIAKDTERQPRQQNPYSIALGSNIQRLRTQAKITKTRFSLMLGIGRPMLNRVESGKANPRLELICAMAEALETTPQELLNIPKEQLEQPEKPPKNAIDKQHLRSTMSR